MYWDFPGVRAEDRLERLAALDATRIRLIDKVSRPAEN
jgi:hypothetical protein